MTIARPADYWFSTYAIFIQLNATGDRNYIHANCSSGSMVMCYMRGIPGLGYDNAHNYRRWPLVASPTVFHDNLARYVYIAIPKSADADAVAQVVFPSEMIDIYGCNEGGTRVGPDTYYYIFTQGIISPSEVGGVVQNRTWQQVIDSGQLASDESIAAGGSDTWWEYIASSDMVKFLKIIAEATFEKLTAAWVSVKQLVLNGKSLNSVASDTTSDTSTDAVATPDYIRKKFLSKAKPDETEFLIKFLAGLECGTFSQGSTGVGIYQDTDGNWHIETDYLDVRVKFTAKEVEIQKVFHIGGAQIKSSASMKCIRVEEKDDVYRCYMNTTDDDGQVVYNQFKAGDQAYVQTFNLERQADGTFGNHFLWRLVTGVGTDYIDLSKADCALASDVPKAFDTLVQLGYRGTDDPSRQVAVIDAGAGADAPYYRQYVGINSFHLPEPETQLKPGDNKLSGVVHIEKGSTGAGNLSDLPDIIAQAQNLGAVNLLRNSGFTGGYKAEDMAEGMQLSQDTELYSRALEHWVGTATVDANTEAVSGRAVVLGSISQDVRLIEGEHYVVSFQACGTQLIVSCGAFNAKQSLNTNFKRYVHSFTFSGAGTFLLSGTATVCDLQLERGTVATDWKPSPIDNDKSMAELYALSYLRDAIRQGSVDIIGGLVLANMIQLGNYKDGKMQRVTAGISGIYNDDDDVADWAGGTFEQAIRTVMAYKDNPKYQPTPKELSNMAKAVRTHGGRAILNDVILRGYIYALGGVFKGSVDIANGKIKLNEDGSGSFSNGSLYWDVYGRVYQKNLINYVWRQMDTEMYSLPNNVMYNIDLKLGTFLDITTSVFNQKNINLPSAEDYPGLVLKIRRFVFSRASTVFPIYCETDGGIYVINRSLGENEQDPTIIKNTTIWLSLNKDFYQIIEDIESVYYNGRYVWIAGPLFT